MASCGGGNSGSALRKWQPTPVFLTEEFHGQRSYGITNSWILLSNVECLFCISLFLQGLANICLSNLCFSISIWIVSFPFWSPKPPFPIFFFECSWRWYLRWGLWPFGRVSFLVSYSVFLSVSHLHRLINFTWYSSEYFLPLEVLVPVDRIFHLWDAFQDVSRGRVTCHLLHLSLTVTVIR